MKWINRRYFPVCLIVMERTRMITLIFPFYLCIFKAMFCHLFSGTTLHFQKSVRKFCVIILPWTLITTSIMLPHKAIMYCLLIRYIFLLGPIIYISSQSSLSFFSGLQSASLIYHQISVKLLSPLVSDLLYSFFYWKQLPFHVLFLQSYVK
jgi:hypothetical protein